MSKLKRRLVDLVCTMLQLQDSRGGSKKNDPQCKPTDHDEASKAYLKFQGTRKLDCPAQIQVIKEGDKDLSRLRGEGV